MTPVGLLDALQRFPQIRVGVTLPAGVGDLAGQIPVARPPLEFLTFAALVDPEPDPVFGPLVQAGKIIHRVAVAGSGVRKTPPLDVRYGGPRLRCPYSASRPSCIVAADRSPGTVASYSPATLRHPQQYQRRPYRRHQAVSPQP